MILLKDGISPLDTFHVVIKLVFRQSNTNRVSQSGGSRPSYFDSRYNKEALELCQGIDAGSRKRDLFKYPLSLSLAMRLQPFWKVGPNFSFFHAPFTLGGP